uniref:Tas protein n=1 Tax=Simian foamy virus TaxID=11642 RepID=A0A2U9AG60_9RETR|nr:tas protein [Simian foamy virus]
MASQQEEDTVKDTFFEELREFLEEFPVEQLSSEVFVAEEPSLPQFWEDPGEGPSGAAAQAEATLEPSEVSGNPLDSVLQYTEQGATPCGPVSPHTEREPRTRWIQQARLETCYQDFEDDLKAFFPTMEQREFVIQRAILAAAGYRPDLARHTASNGWYVCIQRYKGEIDNSYEAYYKCLKCGGESWDPLLYKWDKTALIFVRAWWRTPHTSSPLSTLKRHDLTCPGLHSDSPSSGYPPRRKQRVDPGCRWQQQKRRTDTCPMETTGPTYNFAYTTEWPQPKRMFTGTLEPVPETLYQQGAAATSSTVEPQHQEMPWPPYQ